MLTVATDVSAIRMQEQDKHLKIDVGSVLPVYPDQSHCDCQLTPKGLMLFPPECQVSEFFLIWEEGKVILSWNK